MNILTNTDGIHCEPICTRSLLLSGAIFLFAIVISVNCQADEKLALLEAAKEGNLKQVEMLIGKGADVNQTDESGYTPLMWAARYGYLGIAKKLVDSGAAIEIRNDNNLTAIQIATRFDSFKIAKYLGFITPSNSASREISVQKSDVNIGLQEKDYDSYHDEMDVTDDSKVTERVVPILPELDKFRVKKNITECAGNIADFTISAAWALHINKWKKIRIISPSRVLAERRNYFIDINFFTEKKQIVMGLRYVSKQGNSDTLKYLARQILKKYDFLCSVPGISENVESFLQPKKNHFDFQVSGCIQGQNAVRALVIVSLTDNKWKNIRIQGNNILGNFRTKKINSIVSISIVSEKKQGSIVLASAGENMNEMSDVSESDSYSPEEENKYRLKLKNRLLKKIYKFNKLFCN